MTNRRPASGRRGGTLHLVLGALFGTAFGLLCSFGLAPGDAAMLVVVTVVSATLCALLARRYGGAFWDFVSTLCPWV